MLNQYNDSYSTASSDIQNIVANDVALLEEYILVQTGQYEWTALINTMGINKCRYIRFNRTSTSGYNNYYTISRGDYNGDFGANVDNEYYTYSNIGVGRSLSLPIHETVTSYSVITMCCVLLFAIVFKGAIFKCLKRKR